MEVYNPELTRWRKAKVVYVDSTSEKAKVDWLESEWITICRDNFCPPNTHIRTSSTVLESSCPNGTAYALKIEKKLRDTDMPALAELLEDLAQQSSLPSDKCLLLNQLLQDIGEAYVVMCKDNYKGNIEERRYYEARAALAVERGFRSNHTVVSRTGIEVEQDLGVMGEVAVMPSAMGISRSHMDMLLKTWKRFRDLCADDWPSLRPPERMLLDLADTLELDASRATTVASRRLLFAEAARYMEKGIRFINVRNVRAACCWRIARHYILGLGVDLTDFAAAKSSDIQAGEYLAIRQSGVCEIFTFYMGMLRSLGRWSGGQQQSHPFKYLRAAATGGAPQAAFWMASLLLEGWGTLEGCGMRSRKEELEHTQRLFETCAAFDFLGNFCRRREELVTAMLQHSDGQTRRSYALALHVYVLKLKEKLESTLPYLLFFLVTYIAKQRRVPAPKRGTAQWDPCSNEIMGLHTRAFPSIHVYDMTSPDDALEKAKHQSLQSNASMLRRMNQMWIRQKFNIAYPFSELETLSAEPTETGPVVDAIAASLPAATDTLAPATLATVNLATGATDEPSVATPTKEPKESRLRASAGRKRLLRRSYTLHSSVSTSRVSTAPMDAPAVSPDQGAFVTEGQLVVPAAYSEPPLHGWTPDDCDALLNCVDEVRDLYVTVIASLEGILAPVLEISKRLSVVCRSMPILKSFLDVHFPATVISNLWEVSIQEAEMTHQSIPPDKRFLSEQKMVYDHAIAFAKSPSALERAMEVCMCVGEDTRNHDSTPSEMSTCVLRVINMAHELHQHSGDADDNVLSKHCASAMAVIGYATKNGISTEAAMVDLERLGLPLLRHTPCSMTVTSVGYHVIMEAIRVHDFLHTLDTSNMLLQERMQYLADNPSLSRGWRGTGHERKRSTKTLPEIFKNFKKFVDAQVTARRKLTFPCVMLDLHALTYQDPWAHLGHIDVDMVLADLPQPAAELAAELQMPEIDILEQILTERIRDRFNMFENPAALNDLFLTLGKYQDATSRVLLKKKMLFVLLNAPDVDWQPGSESLQLLFQRLMAGLQEQRRCPDGVSSFCNNFMQEYHFEKCRGALHMLPLDVGKLIISVTTFVFHLKKLFVKLHQSRHKAHYEGRTVGEVVLHDMLLLPLSLPGIYSEVRYPSFATQGYEDVSDMDSDAVCKRFIEGGSIKFSYEEVTIPPLTLRTVINALKSCIVKELTGASPPAADTNPDLQPYPQLDFTIDEDIIMDFVKSDLAMGPFYEMAKQSGFATQNIYFKPMNTGSERADQVTKPFAVQVLRDRAFLRILEVCKYAHVADDFDAVVSSNWELPNKLL